MYMFTVTRVKETTTTYPQGLSISSCVACSAFLRLQHSSHSEDSRAERDVIPSGSRSQAKGFLIKADGFDTQDLCSGDLAERFDWFNSGVGHGVAWVQPQSNAGLGPDFSDGRGEIGVTFPMERAPEG